MTIKEVDVFKLYDEMAIAYTKDIEDYKAIIETIEVIIAQKQRMLQDVNDKTIRFLKTSLEAIPAKKAPVSKKAEKFNYAGIDMNVLSPGKEIAIWTSSCRSNSVHCGEGKIQGKDRTR